MTYQINKAVVIGAGTMGAAIAAHLANVGVEVTLLDIVPRELTPEEKSKGLTLESPQVRNRIVKNGFDAVLKSRPASFYDKKFTTWVSLGNLEDDFDAVAEADWIIEAIIENLKIKQNLMERIDGVRKPKSIVSTNTSGIPVTSIADGRSEGFRQHFLGTHFFNPPRYLKLLEVIPTDATFPEVVDTISWFSEYRLGKGVVLCKDTPNFIGNRITFGTAVYAMDYILKNGYTVEEVDAVTGPPIGHPKTATFRLIDLVGIDVWHHVGENLKDAIPDDKMAQDYLDSEPASRVFDTMLEKGWLGNKTKVGFYKQVRVEGKKEFWPLNLETLEHEAPQKVRFDSVGEAKDKETLGEKMMVFMEGEDRAAELVRALTLQSFAYSAERIPEIADTPKPIDDAMRWGFGHEAGPFEIWDMIGVKYGIDEMTEFGFPPPDWVKQMVDGGFETFYQYQGSQKVGVYNPTINEYQKIERSPNMIVLDEKREAGKVISENPGAAIFDLGDGVAGLEFHTKMNTIDQDMLDMMQEVLDRAEAGEFEGIVIGNDADHFCAGANLFGVVMAAQNGMWKELDELVKFLQDTNMRMRYFHKPVVVCPAGLTLGGGAEITMHGSRVVAAAELYTGQVEGGVGVIPAGGGTKELMRRILNPPMQTDNVDPFPFLQRIFEQIGMAKVATSAEEARAMGFLGKDDRVIINRDHLLAEAKREVLHMAKNGYSPPPPEKIYAAGRDALAGLRVGLYMFKEGGYISDHDMLVGEKLIYIMTGGNLSAPTWVDEQYILDLEREAFLSLCGEEKTQARMWHMLQTGKPLRN